MKRKKISIIVGARPNFIKISPLVKEFNKKRDFFDTKIIHTGQHYDYEMSQIFFEELNIPKPDINLGIRSDKYPFSTQIALIKKELQTILKKNRFHLCIAVGDCNAAIAGALAAAVSQVPLAHVEAGLRSFDKTMSEETNRSVVDILSDFLFTHSKDANENLIREGVNRKKIYFAGNIMIDTLCQYRKQLENQSILRKLRLTKKEYGVLTLHRYSNINVKPVLHEILQALIYIKKEIPLVFPIHPLTAKKINYFFPKISKKLKKEKNLLIIKPLGYLDMLALLKDARLVFTDSGGIQEEATFFKIPCLTLRNNTERPITVELGTNIIAGTTKESILYHFRKIARKSFKIKSKIPPKWDGKTSQRIVDILLSKL